MGTLALYGLKGMTDKAQCTALLAHAAVEVWGLHRLPAIIRLSAGKPVFRCQPELHFNLSHSGSFALCALSDEPVGVDIEAVRPRREGLARRILSPGEFAWYEGHGASAEALLTLWTRKEALCKRSGQGLSFPVREITPPLPEDPSGPPYLLSAAGSGWVASVCAAVPPSAGIIWLSPEELASNR